MYENIDTIADTITIKIGHTSYVSQKKSSPEFLNGQQLITYNLLLLSQRKWKLRPLYYVIGSIILSCGLEILISIHVKLLIMKFFDEKIKLSIQPTLFSFTCNM